MKKLIILTYIILAGITASAQSKKPGIIKYEFSTYKGAPIQKGWLFNDSTYRRLYLSYGAADSTQRFYQFQSEQLQKLSVNYTTIIKEERTRRTEDSLARVRERQQFDSLAVQTRKSTDLTTQVINDSKKKIPLIEAIGIALGTFVIGLLIGHATN